MVRFKNWLRWFKQQPFSFQWVLWLILLRPFIDVFWYVKATSLVSPLQVTGFLTFVLAVIFGFKLRSAQKAKFPASLIFFTLLLIFNLTLILAESMSFWFVVQLVRTLSPIALLFYMIKVIRNEERLHGLIFTYLVSSIFPLSLLLYEVVFGPISVHEVLSDSRGGGYRLSGPYADMFNYLAYLIGDFMILGYLFVRSIYRKRKVVGLGRILLVLFLFSVGVKGLQHQATWVVFFVLIGITGIFSLSNHRVKGYFTMLLIPAVLAGPVVAAPMFVQLFSKELKAYSGEGKQEKVLNGRFVRWEQYFDQWENTEVIPQLLGVSVADLSIRSKIIMTSAGMHSDYVRFLFSSGIIGLTALLIFYATVFNRRKRFRKPEKFFITCTIAILLLYSITSLPLGGSGNMIFILCAGMATALQSPNVFYTSGKRLPSRSSNNPQLG